MPVQIEPSRYKKNEVIAYELMISLSNEIPAPIPMVKADFDWDNNQLSLAIRECADLGVRVERERGCLIISLDTYPLAKDIGNRYYNDVYGSAA